jgi:hypothetical protein
LGGEAAIEFKQAGEGSVVVATDGVAFPVAWRPAYISMNHFNDLNNLDELGFFKRFLAALGVIDPPREVLEKLKEDFPEDLVRPEKIGERMSAGKPVKFEAKNESHLEYLSNVGLLYAASWEFYQKP